MRWPKGKYSGHPITGIEIKCKIDLSWWSLQAVWNFGMPSIHIGPMHIWFSLNYKFWDIVK